MPKTQKLREAKQIGNAIRKARIAKGEALTNISGVFKISIMELNAIEDGNLYFFQNDYAVFMKKALEIFEFLGLDLKNLLQSPFGSKSQTKDATKQIPQFLKMNTPPDIL
jgi:cytoskeletal protein RodZ